MFISSHAVLDFSGSVLLVSGGGSKVRLVGTRCQPAVINSSERLGVCRVPPFLRCAHTWLLLFPRRGRVADARLAILRRVSRLLVSTDTRRRMNLKHKCTFVRTGCCSLGSRTANGGKNHEKFRTIRGKFFWFGGDYGHCHGGGGQSEEGEGRRD